MTLSNFEMHPKINLAPFTEEDKTIHFLLQVYCKGRSLEILEILQACSFPRLCAHVYHLDRLGTIRWSWSKLCQYLSEKSWDAEVEGVGRSFETRSLTQTVQGAVQPRNGGSIPLLTVSEMVLSKHVVLWKDREVCGKWSEITPVKVVCKSIWCQ